MTPRGSKKTIIRGRHEPNAAPQLVTRRPPLVAVEQTVGRATHSVPAQNSPIPDPAIERLRFEIVGWDEA